MGPGSPRIYFNDVETEGFEQLIEKFGRGAFASPYRSTIPLISLVKDEWPRFHSIAAACGAAAGDTSVHFEYKVSPPGVAGNESQTDAMVLSPTSALAVEAKWTEPRYPSVSNRLKSRVAKLTKYGPDREMEHQASQEAVISAWLGLLATESAPTLRLCDASEMVYQMVHRAGSARALSRPARLVYLHFSPSPVNTAATQTQYRADLEALHSLLGCPAQFPFFLVDLPLAPTPAFDAIKNLPKRAHQTDQLVREAIASTRLFDFGTPHIERIAPKFPHPPSKPVLDHEHPENAKARS